MLEKVETVEPGITVATLKGRLKLGSDLTLLESELRELIERGARKLLLDLSQVSQMDSAALGMIVGLTGRIQNVGGRLCLCGLNERLQKTFHTTRVGQVIPNTPGLEEAKEALGG